MLSIEMEDLLDILKERKQYHEWIAGSFIRMNEDSEKHTLIIEKRLSISNEILNIINIINERYDR
jgi:predicted small secreted protein